MENSDHLLKLINNLLDITKIELEKTTKENNKINIKELLEKIITALETLSNENNCRFKIIIQKELTFIYSDETKLKQIIINIVTNAMRYSKKEGNIIIKVKKEKEKDKILISIKDNGIGIEEEKQKLIFDAFKQIDQGDTKAITQHGSGLGLYITNKLVELLNGTISIKSPGKNYGTTVDVLIPINKK